MKYSMPPLIDLRLDLTLSFRVQDLDCAQRLCMTLAPVPTLRVNLLSFHRTNSTPCHESPLSNLESRIIPREWAIYISNLEGIIRTLDPQYPLPSRPLPPPLSLEVFVSFFSNLCRYLTSFQDRANCEPF